MPFTLDAELLQAAMLRYNADTRTPGSAARGDWRGLREVATEGISASEAAMPAYDDVERRDFATVSFDGTKLLVRWYWPKGKAATGPGPAVVYLHGGGMILGSVELYDRMVASYVSESGVPMLSVDYRLAPEDPHPAPVEDCFSGLAWLHEQSDELGVDPSRIAVMGDSAGGGLAAGVALLATERNVALARQILIYPMLDDRTITPDPAIAPFAGWTYDNNFTGWSALLGNAFGSQEVPAAAAPARASDLSGLPNAYIEVGELDIFRDECVEYARRLALVGTSAELHVHPGCPHGFDRLGSTIDVVRRSRADRLRVLQSL